METINDRMEMLVNERFAGNKAAFAKKIGLPPTGLSSYLGKQRRSKPSIDMVAKIITEVGVDALWLITGEKSKDSSTSAVVNDSISPASENQSDSVDVYKKEIERLQSLLNKKRTTKVVLELDVDDDEFIKMGLKDKAIQILNK
ncbi:MAG: XRE family transcriptional regulator [Bacteroidaceae bacterium]